MVPKAVRKMEQNEQDAVDRRRPFDEAFKRDAVRVVAAGRNRWRKPAHAGDVRNRVLHEPFRKLLQQRRRRAILLIAKAPVDQT